MNNKTGRICDENCNECPIFRHPNMRMISSIFNQAYDKFGDEFYAIVQKACPNLTCCYDCHVDDFCHVEGCEILKYNEEQKKRKT